MRGWPTEIEPATFSRATIRRPPFPGVALCCRIGSDKPTSLLAVARPFCVFRAEWCQMWCQMASIAPPIRWVLSHRGPRRGHLRFATFHPILVTPCGYTLGANGRSLRVGESLFSLLSISHWGRFPGTYCPNKLGNHPLPPGIVVPLE